MTSLLPISMSYEDSVASCWNSTPEPRKYQPYSLMKAIYCESPLMTVLVQRAGLESMLEKLHGTCFCPSFSYSVYYKNHFESITPIQARKIVLASCSPLLIQASDIRDCIRIPTCDGGYLDVDEVSPGTYALNNDTHIIKMDKQMVDVDGNLTGIVYVLNGLINASN